MRLLLVLTAVLFFPVIATAQTTYYVPDDFPSIQDAINGDCRVITSRDVERGELFPSCDGSDAGNQHDAEHDT